MFSGMIILKNTAKRLVAMPLRPLPNMMAPMYCPGRKPALAKTLHYTIPLTPPKINNRTKHAQKHETGLSIK